jgi:hypothetical protein
MKQPKINNVDSLRLKVAAAKSELQAMGYRNYIRGFIEAYPKYDNHVSISEITSVFQLRKADVNITKDICAYVSKMKKQLA